MSDELVNLDNFRLFRRDRDTITTGKKSGGGVCTYVNTKWCNPQNCHYKYSYSDKNIEMLTVSIRPYYIPREFTHVLVTTIYMPPDANYNEALEYLSSHVHDLQTQSPDAFIIITGDFNKCVVKSSLSGFSQLINTPTRGSSTLDLLFTNVKDSHICDKLCPLGRSDHNLLYLYPSYVPLTQREPPTQKTISLWTKETWDTLRECFACTDWDLFVCSTDNVSELAETVCDYISFCVQSVVPTKTITLFANNKPWVTKEIKHVLNKKKIAFNSNDQEGTKQVQKELKTVVREGKKVYRKKIEEELKKNNMKCVWDGISLMSGSKKRKTCSNLNNTTGYANELNEFYGRFDCHDFKSERDERNKLLNERRVNECDNIIIEEKHVLNTLQKLKPNKSSGPDEINPNVLKYCANELYKILCIIFNMSLTQCHIPSLWKTSIIIPVPKKTNVKCMNDLRPIALTSCIMKVFEKCIINHLQKFLSPFMDPLQFAYKSNRGVDDALLHVLNNISSHLEKTGTCVRLMFFDFSSAFNTIQPHLLCDKLIKYGLPPSLTSWILDYLTERPQCVRLDSTTHSNKITTCTGAPQGTVLAPFLFSIYTSDFKPTHANCIIDKYADDTILIGLIKDDNTADYISEVNALVDWCTDNFLILNVEKTKEMVIDFRKNKATQPEICIHNKSVERVDSFKYLGIIFDEDLTWKSNTENIVKKIKPRMYCLRKLKSFDVDKQLLKMFYTSMITSVLTFGASCWGGNIGKHDQNRINKIIEKAGKVIGETQGPFNYILKQRDISNTERILKDTSHPLYDEYDSRLIRRSGRYRIPKCRTNRYKYTFIPRSITHLNETHQRIT